jgi:RNA polymerase sigma-70 factor (ECF subfamily)
MGTTPFPLTLKLLYESEFSYVWKSLRRMGVASQDLQDVAHDVFVQVHLSLPSYDPSRPLRPWLFGIVFRVVSGSRRRKSNSETPVEVEPEPSNQNPEQALALSQDHALVHSALQTLPDDRRAIFIMHELDGHPMPAIADVIGVPLNTCYSRLRIGRTEFKKAVQRLRPSGGPP